MAMTKEQKRNAAGNAAVGAAALAGGAGGLAAYKYRNDIANAAKSVAAGAQSLYGNTVAGAQNLAGKASTGISNLGDSIYDAFHPGNGFASNGLSADTLNAEKFAMKAAQRDAIAANQAAALANAEAANSLGKSQTAYYNKKNLIDNTFVKNPGNNVLVTDTGTGNAQNVHNLLDQDAQHWAKRDEMTIANNNREALVKNLTYAGAGLAGAATAGLGVYAAKKLIQRAKAKKAVAK